MTHRKAFVIKSGDLLKLPTYDVNRDPFAWYLVISDIHEGNKFWVLSLYNFRVNRWFCSYLVEGYEIFREGELLL